MCGVAPGTAPQFVEPQMHQAFHDGMSPTWRECLPNAGNSVATMTVAQVVQRFHKQEVQDTKNMSDKIPHQHQQAMANMKTKAGPHSDSHPLANHNAKSNDNSKCGRTQPECLCTVHPRLGHKWGECVMPMLTMRATTATSTPSRQRIPQCQHGQCGGNPSQRG